MIAILSVHKKPIVLQEVHLLAMYMVGTEQRAAICITYCSLIDQEKYPSN